MSGVLREPFEPEEIQERVRQKFLERLETRLQVLRGLIVKRDWLHLEEESRHIAEGARKFGFKELSLQAHGLAQLIRAERPSRHSAPFEVRTAVEKFLNHVDRLLIEKRNKN